MKTWLPLLRCREVACQRVPEYVVLVTSWAGLRRACLLHVKGDDVCGAASRTSRAALLNLLATALTHPNHAQWKVGAHSLAVMIALTEWHADGHARDPR